MPRIWQKQAQSMAKAYQRPNGCMGRIENSYTPQGRIENSYTPLGANRNSYTPLGVNRNSYSPQGPLFAPVTMFSASIRPYSASSRLGTDRNNTPRLSAIETEW